MKIQQGTTSKNFWQERIPPVHKHEVEIIFSSPFMRIPHVLLSLERIDEGQFIENSAYKQNGKPILHTVNRYDMSAQNVTNTGFILKLETWHQNMIYGYRINWIAISDED